MKKILTLVAVACLITACAKTPTGRSQLKLHDANKMAQMGAQSFEQIKEQEKINKDVKTNQYVQCIADRIIAVLPNEGWRKGWEVVVFDSEQVNAFALPGKKIGVYTGLLKVAENQDQLAAVMGHEVGHVMADHGNERVSQGQLMNAGLQVINAVMTGSEYQSTAMAALGVGTQVGVMLPFSRKHESEADVIGLKLMMQAGFEAEQSMKLWENMSKGGGRQLEILSTHPAPTSRITNLGKNIEKYRAEGVVAEVDGPDCKKPA